MNLNDIIATIEAAAAATIQSKFSKDPAKAQAATGMVSKAFAALLANNPDMKEILSSGIDLAPLTASLANAVYLCVRFDLYPGGMPGMDDVQINLRRKSRNVGSYDNPKWITMAVTAEWQPTSRGLRRYFKRNTGYDVRPVLVAHHEKFRYSKMDRKVTEHELSDESYVATMDDDSFKCAYAMLIDGQGNHYEDVLVTRQAVLDRRECSEDYKAWIRKPVNQRKGEPIWVKWFEEMALKTVVVYAVKHGPILLDPSGYDFLASADNEEREEETTDTTALTSEAVIARSKEPATMKEAARLMIAELPPEEPIVAPVKAKEPVVIEAQATVAPVTQNAATPPVDAAKAKAKAVTYEQQLPAEVVAELRAKHGIALDSDLPRSKYAVDKIIGYGKDLGAAIEKARSTPKEDDLPPIPPVDDDDLPPMD